MVNYLITPCVNNWKNKLQSQIKEKNVNETKITTYPDYQLPFDCYFEWQVVTMAKKTKFKLFLSPYNSDIRHHKDPKQFMNCIWDKRKIILQP